MNEDKKDDEMYKICPNCGKLIKWKDRVCSYCGVPYHKPQFQELRGGMTHPVNSDKNFRTVTPKRPISIVLVVLLGIVFLITILASLGSSPILLMYIIIYLLIFIIITFSLIFVNLRKNKNRTLSFLISTCVLIAILIVSSVGFSNIESKKNVAKVIPQNTNSTTITETTETTQETTPVIEDENATIEAENRYLSETSGIVKGIKAVYEDFQNSINDYNKGFLTLEDLKVDSIEFYAGAYTAVYYFDSLEAPVPESLSDYNRYFSKFILEWRKIADHVKNFIKSTSNKDMVSELKAVSDCVKAANGYMEAANAELNKLKQNRR